MLHCCNNLQRKLRAAPSDPAALARARMPRGSRYALDASDVTALLSDDPPKATKRRKKKDPAAPKEPANAFLLFAVKRRAELKEEPERAPLSFTEASKAIADEWRALGAAERAPFELRAKREREEYDEAKAAYVPVPACPCAGRLTKTGRLRKDPLRPKDPHSAYFYFLESSRPALVRRSPGLSVPQLTKALAAEWRALDDAGRAPYAELAAADKARHAAQLASYTESSEYVAARAAYRRVRAGMGDEAVAQQHAAADASLAEENARLRAAVAEKAKQIERQARSIERLTAQAAQAGKRRAAGRAEAADARKRGGRGAGKPEGGGASGGASGASGAGGAGASSDGAPPAKRRGRPPASGTECERRLQGPSSPHLEGVPPRLVVEALADLARGEARPLALA